MAKLMCNGKTLSSWCFVRRTDNTVPMRYPVQFTRARKSLVENLMHSNPFPELHQMSLISG